MNTIEVSFSYDKGLAKDLRKTGEIVFKRRTILVHNISTITEYVGKYAHSGKVCTIIRMADGSDVLDDRPYSEFIKLL
jgi:hypothetical protein